MGEKHDTETISLTLIPAGTVLMRWGNFVLCAHEVPNVWCVYLPLEISKQFGSQEMTYITTKLLLKSFLSDFDETYSMCTTTNVWKMQSTYGLHAFLLH